MSPKVEEASAVMPEEVDAAEAPGAAPQQAAENPVVDEEEQELGAVVPTYPEDSVSANFEVPWACCRIGFGPPVKIGKNRKKHRKCRLQRKKQPKKRKNGSKIGFRGHSHIFRLLFRYFLAEAVPYSFPILSYFGPEARNLFCSRPTGSQHGVSTLIKKRPDTH